MEWKEKYCVGIKQIDDQHKLLVDMITKLQESAAKEDVNSEMRKVLKEMVEYTKFHFADEEKFMNKIGYPERGRQRSLHDKFIREVIKILQNLKMGKELSNNELISFLINWLVNHIIKEDMRIGTYYNHEYKR